MIFFVGEAVNPFHTTPAKLVREAGVKPAAFGFGNQRSIRLSYSRENLS